MDANGNLAGPNPSATGYRFDSSGQDFILTNGVYRPTISVEVSTCIAVKGSTHGT